MSDDQLTFFEVAPDARCASGQHGRLRGRLPVVTETSVSVDYVCERCSMVVSTESWQRPAYEKRFGRLEPAS